MELLIFPFQVINVVPIVPIIQAIPTIQLIPIFYVDSVMDTVNDQSNAPTINNSMCNDTITSYIPKQKKHTKCKKTYKKTRGLILPGELHKQQSEFLIRPGESFEMLPVAWRNVVINLSHDQQ